MAQAYGVNIETYPNGSGLTDDLHQVATVALGSSSLTVNEQTQMIATIDDNGVYHAGHVIKYWQLPNGPKQTPSVQSHVVLTPAQDSQVQYAMEATTVDGTAVDAAAGLGGRQIIGKTGTTSGALRLRLGAIPQYAMVVGMFANAPNTANVNDSLAALGGGGFGGYWPAKIWNTFFQAEFASLPAENFQSPQFSGNLWNMIGKLPKAKPKKKPTKCNPQQGGGNGNGNGKGNGGGGHGHGNQLQLPAIAVGCGTTSPTPTPTPTPTNTASGNPTSTPTGLPTTTVTPTPTTSGSSTPTSTASATPTPTASTTHTGFPFAAADSAATTESGVKAGLAVGGVLVTVLPGSLLWTSAARRRRRRRSGVGSAPGTGTEG